MALKEIGFSDGPTYLIPLDLEEWVVYGQAVRFRGQAFDAKREVHITVVNKDLGAKLEDLIRIDPKLESRIAQAIEEADWAALARDIDKLRLSRMLTGLGIDVTSYLHSERIVDIQQQMGRCSDCGRTAECDDRLAHGEVDAADIGFCNNEQSLHKMLERDKTPASTQP